MSYLMNRTDLIFAYGIHFHIKMYLKKVKKYLKNTATLIVGETRGKCQLLKIK